MLLDALMSSLYSREHGVPNDIANGIANCGAQPTRGEPVDRAQLY